MILIFSFAINQETKEATWSGNISAVDAAGLLQNIVIQRLQEQANRAGEAKKPEEVKDDSTGVQKQPKNRLKG